MADPWTDRLLEQLTWPWEHQLRPGLEGLADDEVTWEPVPGMWGVRPRGEGRAAIEAGRGPFVLDWAFPEPVPPPPTTIGWRLWHVNVGVLGMRNASHFGGPAVDYDTMEVSPLASVCLDALDEGRRRWVAGVRALGDEGLERPIGPAEGPWADHPYAALVLHIHRELLHHLAEVLLLRDLFRARA